MQDISCLWRGVIFLGDLFDCSSCAGTDELQAVFKKWEPLICLSCIFLLAAILQKSKNCYDTWNKNRHLNHTRSDIYNMLQAQSNLLSFLWETNPELFQNLQPTHTILSKGSYLFKQGDSDDKIRFVLSGKLSVMCQTDCGMEEVGVLEPGDEITQLVSVLDVLAGKSPSPLDVSVKASEHSDILTLDTAVLCHEVTKDRTSSLCLIENIVSRVSRTISNSQHGIPPSIVETQISQTSASTLSRHSTERILMISKKEIAVQCGIKDSSLLDGYLAIKRYPKDFVIYGQGETNYDILYIVSGCISGSRQSNSENSDIDLYVTEPGDLIGTVSLLSGSSLLCSLRCCTDVQVVEINREAFQRICRDNPEVMAKVAQQACRKFLLFLKMNDQSLSWIRTEEESAEDILKCSNISSLDSITGSRYSTSEAPLGFHRKMSSSKHCTIKRESSPSSSSMISIQYINSRNGEVSREVLPGPVSITMKPKSYSPPQILISSPVRSVMSAPRSMSRSCSRLQSVEDIPRSCPPLSVTIPRPPEFAQLRWSAGGVRTSLSKRPMHQKCSRRRSMVRLGSAKDSPSPSPPVHHITVTVDCANSKSPTRASMNQRFSLPTVESVNDIPLHRSSRYNIRDNITIPHPPIFSHPRFSSEGATKSSPKSYTRVEIRRNPRSPIT